MAPTLPAPLDRRSWGRRPGPDATKGPEGALHQCEIRRRPTLPGDLSPSTIGAGGLNFRVRKGNGCDPAAMATGNLVVKGAPRRGGGCSCEHSIASTSKTKRVRSKPSAD
jgi:hypothetical protein